MNYEKSAGNRAEVASQYEHIGHSELIGAFYESQGNPEIGRELSVRLFEHAGLAGDPKITPLIGRDGTQIYDGESPLSLADYINYATKHHFSALSTILDFLEMQPGSQDYSAMQVAIIERLSAGNR